MMRYDACPTSSDQLEIDWIFFCALHMRGTMKLTGWKKFTARTAWGLNSGLYAKQKGSAVLDYQANHL